MKRVFKILLSVLPALLASSASFGQAAYLDKPEEFDPAKPTKIMVNLKLTKNEFGIIEAAAKEDMYLWIWKPVEHPAGHPLANGTGSAAWKSSNDALKMTKESDGLYSYTFTPTEFFGVTPAAVYKEDFHFLVKPKDGGGYGDPDIKTEDLKIEVDPPAGPVVKLRSLPVGIGEKKDTLRTTTADVFTLLYNNSVEEKSTMTGATELYIYPVAYDENDVAYKVAPNAKRVADYPQLKMRKNASGLFQHSFIPEKLFTVPAGVKIIKMEFNIVKPNLINSDDQIDEKPVYFINQGGC